jgi:hypothetical protein
MISYFFTVTYGILEMELHVPRNLSGVGKVGTEVAPDSIRRRPILIPLEPSRLTHQHGNSQRKVT